MPHRGCLRPRAAGDGCVPISFKVSFAIECALCVRVPVHKGREGLRLFWSIGRCVCLSCVCVSSGSGYFQLLSGSSSSHQSLCRDTGVFVTMSTTPQDATRPPAPPYPPASNTQQQDNPPGPTPTPLPPNEIHPDAMHPIPPPSTPLPTYTDAQHQVHHTITITQSQLAHTLQQLAQQQQQQAQQHTVATPTATDQGMVDAASGEHHTGSQPHDHLFLIGC